MGLNLKEKQVQNENENVQPNCYDRWDHVQMNGTLKTRKRGDKKVLLQCIVIISD